MAGWRASPWVSWVMMNVCSDCGVDRSVEIAKWSACYFGKLDVAVRADRGPPYRDPGTTRPPNQCPPAQGADLHVPIHLGDVIVWHSCMGGQREVDPMGGHVRPGVRDFDLSLVIPKGVGPVKAVSWGAPPTTS